MWLRAAWATRQRRQLRGFVSSVHQASRPPQPPTLQLKYHPNQLYVDFQAKHYVGPTLDLTDKQVAAMADAAAGFNEVGSASC